MYIGGPELISLTDCVLERDPRDQELAQHEIFQDTAGTWLEAAPKATAGGKASTKGSKLKDLTRSLSTASVAPETDGPEECSNCGHPLAKYEYPISKYYQLSKEAVELDAYLYSKLLILVSGPYLAMLQQTGTPSYVRGIKIMFTAYANSSYHSKSMVFRAMDELRFGGTPDKFQEDVLNLITLITTSRCTIVDFINQLVLSRVQEKDEATTSLMRREMSEHKHLTFPQLTEVFMHAVRELKDKNIHGGGRHVNSATHQQRRHERPTPKPTAKKTCNRCGRQATHVAKDCYASTHKDGGTLDPKTAAPVPDHVKNRRSKNPKGNRPPSGARRLPSSAYPKENRTRYQTLLATLGKPSINSVNINMVRLNPQPTTTTPTGTPTKQELGQRIYPTVHVKYPERAGKITGMILEMETDDIMELLDNSDLLQSKIEEAVNVLDEHLSQMEEPTRTAWLKRNGITDATSERQVQKRSKYSEFTPESHSSTLHEKVSVDKQHDPAAVGKYIAECHARHPRASSPIGNKLHTALAAGTHLDRQPQVLPTSQKQERRAPVIVVEEDPPPKLLLTAHAVQSLASEAERQIASATGTEVYEPETLFVERKPNSVKRHAARALHRTPGRRPQLSIMSTHRAVTGESDTEVDTSGDDTKSSPPTAEKPTDTPSTLTPTSDSSSVAARFRATLQRVPREHLTDVLHQVLEQAEKLVERTIDHTVGRQKLSKSTTRTKGGRSPTPRPTAPQQPSTPRPDRSPPAREEYLKQEYTQQAEVLMQRLGITKPCTTLEEMLTEMHVKCGSTNWCRWDDTPRQLRELGSQVDRYEYGSRQVRARALLLGFGVPHPPRSLADKVHELNQIVGISPSHWVGTMDAQLIAIENKVTKLAQDCSKASTAEKSLVNAVSTHYHWIDAGKRDSGYVLSPAERMACDIDDANEHDALVAAHPTVPAATLALEAAAIKANLRRDKPRIGERYLDGANGFEEVVVINDNVKPTGIYIVGPNPQQASGGARQSQLFLKDYVPPEGRKHAGNSQWIQPWTHLTKLPYYAMDLGTLEHTREYVDPYAGVEEKYLVSGVKRSRTESESPPEESRQKRNRERLHEVLDSLPSKTNSDVNINVVALHQQRRQQRNRQRLSKLLDSLQPTTEEDANINVVTMHSTSSTTTPDTMHPTTLTTTPDPSPIKHEPVPEWATAGSWVHSTQYGEALIQHQVPGTGSQLSYAVLELHDGRIMDEYHNQLTAPLTELEPLQIVHSIHEPNESPLVLTKRNTILPRTSPASRSAMRAHSTTVAQESTPPNTPAAKRKRSPENHTPTTDSDNSSTDSEEDARERDTLDRIASCVAPMLCKDCNNYFDGYLKQVKVLEALKEESSTNLVASTHSESHSTQSTQWYPGRRYKQGETIPVSHRRQHREHANLDTSDPEERDAEPVNIIDASLDVDDPSTIEYQLRIQNNNEDFAIYSQFFGNIVQFKTLRESYNDDHAFKARYCEGLAKFRHAYRQAETDDLEHSDRQPAPCDNAAKGCKCVAYLNTGYCSRGCSQQNICKRAYVHDGSEHRPSLPIYPRSIQVCKKFNTLPPPTSPAMTYPTCSHPRCSTISLNGVRSSPCMSHTHQRTFTEKENHPCRNAHRGCKCVSHNGEPGQHCCLTCRRGTVCQERYHPTPSSFPAPDPHVREKQPTTVVTSSTQRQTTTTSDPTLTPTVNSPVQRQTTTISCPTSNPKTESSVPVTTPQPQEVEFDELVQVDGMMLTPFTRRSIESIVNAHERYQAFEMADRELPKADHITRLDTLLRMVLYTAPFERADAPVKVTEYTTYVEHDSHSAAVIALECQYFSDSQPSKTAAKQSVAKVAFTNIVRQLARLHLTATPSSDSASHSGSDADSDTTTHEIDPAATQLELRQSNNEEPPPTLTSTALASTQVNMIVFERTEPCTSVTTQYTYNSQPFGVHHSHFPNCYGRQTTHQLDEYDPRSASLTGYLPPVNVQPATLTTAHNHSITTTEVQSALEYENPDHSQPNEEEYIPVARNPTATEDASDRDGDSSDDDYNDEYFRSMDEETTESTTSTTTFQRLAHSTPVTPRATHRFPVERQQACAVIYEEAEDRDESWDQVKLMQENTGTTHDTAEEARWKERVSSEMKRTGESEHYVCDEINGAHESENPDEYQRKLPPWHNPRPTQVPKREHSEGLYSGSEHCYSDTEDLAEPLHSFRVITEMATHSKEAPNSTQVVASSTEQPRPNSPLTPESHEMVQRPPLLQWNASVKRETVAEPAVKEFTTTLRSHAPVESTLKIEDSVRSYTTTLRTQTGSAFHTNIVTCRLDINRAASHTTDERVEQDSEDFKAALDMFDLKPTEEPSDEDMEMVLTALDRCAEAGVHLAKQVKVLHTTKLILDTGAMAHVLTKVNNIDSTNCVNLKGFEGSSKRSNGYGDQAFHTESGPVIALSGHEIEGLQNNLISVGALVNDQGYEFHCNGRHDCFLVSPDGSIIDVEVTAENMFQVVLSTESTSTSATEATTTVRSNDRSVSLIETESQLDGVTQTHQQEQEYQVNAATRIQPDERASRMLHDSLNHAPEERIRRTLRGARDTNGVNPNRITHVDCPTCRRVRSTRAPHSTKRDTRGNLNDWSGDQDDMLHTEPTIEVTVNLANTFSRFRSVESHCLADVGSPCDGNVSSDDDTDPPPSTAIEAPPSSTTILTPTADMLFQGKTQLGGLRWGEEIYVDNKCYTQRINGKLRYALVAYDRCSNMMLAVDVISKSHNGLAMKEIICMLGLNKITSYTICVMSDQCGSMVHVRKACIEAGIRHLYLVPSEQSLNPVERCIGYIWSVATTLLQHAGVYDAKWEPYAVQYVNYCHARMAGPRNRGYCSPLQLAGLGHQCISHLHPFFQEVTANKAPRLRKKQHGNELMYAHQSDGYFVGFMSMFNNIAMVYHPTTDSITRQRVKNINWDMEHLPTTPTIRSRDAPGCHMQFPKKRHSAPRKSTTQLTDPTVPAATPPTPSQVTVQPSADIPSEEEYAVEQLLAHRRKGGVKEYLVKWKDYDSSHNSWEPVGNIEQSLVAQYNSELPLAASTVRASKSTIDTSYIVHSDDGPTIDHDIFMAKYDALDPKDTFHRQEMIHALSLHATKDMSWKKALADPVLGPKAIAACNKELDSLSQTIFERIPDNNLQEIEKAKKLGTKCRILLDIKRDSRVKARCVKIGFRENYTLADGADFIYYASVARLCNIRMSAFRPNRNGAVIATIDLDCAFLQATPFEKGKHKYCYFRNPVTGKTEYMIQKGVIYGEKSAPRRWLDTLCPVLLKLGFTQGENERCAFTNTEGLHILVYVDDLWMSGSKSEVLKFVELLRRRFKAKEVSWLTKETPIDFLGMLFRMDNDRIYLSMREYIEKVMDGLQPQTHGMTTSPVKLPISKTVTDMTPLTGEAKKFYCSGTGCVGWLNGTGRPDICYLYSRLSQHLATPCMGALTLLLQGLAYLNQHKDYCLSARLHGTKQWEAFCDTDFAGDTEPVAKRVSTNAMVLTLNDAPVDWSGKKSSVCFPHQQMTEAVADVSSAAVEIYGAGNASRTILGNSYQAEEIGIPFPLPFELQMDNEAAIAYIYDSSSRSKLRHIDCRAYWIRALRDQNIMKAIYVPSALNKSDLMTKIHDYPTFEKLRGMLMHLYTPPG